MVTKLAIEENTDNTWRVFLRGIRRRFGWTQQDLAEKLGVCAGTIKAWETGQCYPPYYLKFALFYIEGRTIPLPGRV